MRVVKFRGLELEHKFMVYGSLISFDPIPEIQETILGEMDYDYPIYEVVPESIGQFIGIKDKNGVEVYEGDLISYYGSEELKQIGYSEDGRLVWKTKHGNFTINTIEIHDPFQYEVKGNIHENKYILN